MQILEYAPGLFAGVLQLALILVAALQEALQFLLQLVLALHQRVPLVLAAPFDLALAAAGLLEFPLGLLQPLQVLLQAAEGFAQLVITRGQVAAFPLELLPQRFDLPLAGLQPRQGLFQPAGGFAEGLVTGGEAVVLLLEPSLEVSVVCFQARQAPVPLLQGCVEGFVLPLHRAEAFHQLRPLALGGLQKVQALFEALQRLAQAGVAGGQGFLLALEFAAQRAALEGFGFPQALAL